MSNVLIYTTTTCPYCKMAKNYFKEKGIAYTEKDVTNDAATQEEMIKKTGQMAVPVIDIGGKTIVGFDREAIEKTLGV
ncbi:glutaredoxin family protein [Candidatus Uhrbacteria bacterium]|nr:glutaredoxin family protein [Candidatus Uhrbacteria bacterium]